jgi:FkbM family methyltransferase
VALLFNRCHHLLAEAKQRLINIEDKINHLLSHRQDPNGFTGSPDQRYGHVTYSQHGEDLVFAALFEQLGIARPRYLDIGANHPFNCSNTALLHQRGASGINIDASPDVIETFKRHRPHDLNLNLGVAGKPGTLTFYRIDATSGRNSFSRAAVEKFIAECPQFKIMDELTIPVMTLDQIIETYCAGICPDLLSLDAEGFDYEILAAASFTTRPKILCVETLSANGEIESQMNELLTAKGFHKKIQMHANAIYLDQKL